MPARPPSTEFRVTVHTVYTAISYVITLYPVPLESRQNTARLHVRLANILDYYYYDNRNAFTLRIFWPYG